jgi:hypothetical protein
MNDQNHRLSRRGFVENSALAAGLMGMAGLAPASVQGAGPDELPGGTSFTPVDARQFGAKGDGKADDTAAVQSALDAAKTKGPVCFLPAGLYRLTGSLVVPPGVTLRGASGGVPHSEQPRDGRR